LPQIVGQKFSRFVAIGDRDLFNTLLAMGEQASGKDELALCAADGTIVPVYFAVVALPDEDQRIVSGIVTDLRWQKQRLRELADANTRLLAVMGQREHAETLLRQAQKMEAVGQLTAGIAHDFNNLLMVISGNLELFLAHATDGWLKHRVEAGQRAVERGARLTLQLLAFASRQSLRPHPLCVNALVRDLDSLLRSSLGDGIRLTLNLGADLPPCLIDPTELQAAILNLVKNAKDAMPSGGVVSIVTTEAVLESQPEVGDSRGGRYLLLTVTDSGHGMPPEISQRAFDPFFTTKDIGLGSGLGLSRVYGFMHQSGGRVTIDSAPGIGTSVRLYLPSGDAVAIEHVSPQAVVPPRLAPPRRILVVEDDQHVRELVVEVLEGLDYIAIPTESGIGALHLLDSGMTVDLVFSDVQMPDGMSGFQLAREIHRRQPGLPIVLTSGMTGTFESAPVDAIADLPLLRKPYRCDDLALAIATALVGGRA
jgi:signal transduction histidine kinase/CheY-like chemotaxis protein